MKVYNIKGTLKGHPRDTEAKATLPTQKKVVTETH